MLLGEIDLRERGFFESIGNEFYMAPSPLGIGCPVGRLSLAKRMLVEHATIAVS